MTKIENTSLKLTLTEDRSTVRLLLIDNDQNVVDFENFAPEKVRTTGFNHRNAGFERIIAFLERESTYETASHSKLLEMYIDSMEKEIYTKSLLLRKEMRKLAILGSALKTAKILKATALKIPPHQTNNTEAEEIK